MIRGFSIQTKIVVPFVCLFLVATLLTAFYTMRVTSGLVEDVWRRQIVDAAKLLGPGGVPATPGTLKQLKKVLGVDIVRLDAKTGAMIGTLTDEQAEEFRRELSRPRTGPLWQIHSYRLPAPRAAPDALEAESIPVTLSGVTHKAYFAPIRAIDAAPAGRTSRPIRPVLFLLVPTELLSQAKRRAARPIVVVAAVSLVLVLVVGYFIAATITRPVRRLADVTREIAAGRLGERVSVGSRDELAELAASFNSMVEGLRDSQARLIQAERLAAIGELAAGVAHEIRNPLSAIRMNVQMLLESHESRVTSDESSDARPATRDSGLLEEIDRLELTVEGLLTFARPSAPALEPTNLAEVVGSVITLLRRQFDHAHITVETHFDPDLGPIRADPAKLKQVAINLLINAMGAMARGGTIETVTRQEGDWAVLEVHDTGEGIDPAMAEKIFEPFVTTRAKGTGLGLAICRQIVLEHGGEITCEPAAAGKQGTVFRVRLPIGGQPLDARGHSA